MIRIIKSFETFPSTTFNIFLYIQLYFQVGSMGKWLIL